MTEAEQVARGGQSAIPVGRPDGRRVVERLAGRVDDHQWNAPRRELRAERLAQIREHGDHPGRPAGEDALDPATSRCPPALHLGEDDREMILAGDALDAAHDLERPFALELMKDQLEDRRSPVRPDGRPVAVLADDRLDPAARLGRYVRSPVEHLGDRRNGHSRLLGDRGDRRCLALGTGRGRAGGAHEPSVSTAHAERKFRTRTAAWRGDAWTATQAHESRRPLTAPESHAYSS